MENHRIAIFREIQNVETGVPGRFLFFDARGVILAHAVPQGKTADAAYYTKVLE